MNGPASIGPATIGPIGPGPRRPEVYERDSKRIEEDAVEGSAIAALDLSREAWLFLSLLGCVTLFFKFSRFWSVRNLDLLLLFVLVPGILMIVQDPEHHPWAAYLWLFFGSGLWLLRCILDLGLSRRPLLEPNLNASGLLCLSLGILGLMLVETVNLPVEEGAARNPAEPSGRADRPPLTSGPESPTIHQVKEMIPLLPPSLKQELPQVILQRVLAGLAHLGLVLGLLAIGWRHFERPIAGMAMSACYLILPYTRLALVDSGQLIASALIVAAVFWHARPALAGALIGLAAGWVPACLGLIGLWFGFYWGRGARRFLFVAAVVVAGCVGFGHWLPELGRWAGALGARSIAEVGLLPSLEPPSSNSFWSNIDSSFRFPVLVAYLALVIWSMVHAVRKGLAELIALSAALLVASQFWYLDKGGALVMLYLPLAIAMMFRPTLAARRHRAGGRRRGAASLSLRPAQ